MTSVDFGRERFDLPNYTRTAVELPVSAHEIANM